MSIWVEGSWLADGMRAKTEPNPAPKNNKAQATQNSKSRTALRQHFSEPTEGTPAHRRGAGAGPTTPAAAIALAPAPALGRLQGRHCLLRRLPTRENAAGVGSVAGHGGEEEGCGGLEGGGRQEEEEGERGGAGLLGLLVEQKKDRSIDRSINDYIRPVMPQRAASYLPCPTGCCCVSAACLLACCSVARFACVHRNESVFSGQTVSRPADVCLLRFPRGAF